MPNKIRNGSSATHPAPQPAAEKRTRERPTARRNATPEPDAGQARALREEIEVARRQLDAALTEVEALRGETDRARRQFEDAERDLAAARERLCWLQEEIRLEEAHCRQELGRFREEFRRWSDELRRDSEEPRQRLAAARLATRPEPADAPEATDGTAEMTVVQAHVRYEPAQERLARYLNDAWAVENGQLESLKEMVDEVIDPSLRETLAEQGVATRRQKQALEERLRQLGREPSGGKGLFARLVEAIWGGMGRPADDYDRTVQHLMKAYGAAHFGTAMYRVVAALAAAVGDQETLALAGAHLEQKEVAARRLEGALAPLAALAAQLPRLEAPADASEEVADAP